MTIGVVGVGLLGTAVAGRLLKAGHRVVGFDTAPDRVRALLGMGGEAAASARAVALASEAVCTLLPTLPSVEAAVLGPDGVAAAGKPGQVLIQMSTISPALTARLAAESRARGLDFLDCPVSGTSGVVARGEGVLFVGGERRVFERWRPLLESMLPRAIYIGAAGQAMVLKLVANLLVALHSVAAAEALHLARRAGLDPAVALEVLVGSAAGSRMLELRGPLMVRGEYPAQMKLDLFMKDLHLIQDAAAAAGAALPLTDTAERLYAAAAGTGHGGEDLAVVLTALAALSPRRREA
ncbi:MAG TPA: NAD(P)-dependent oxidoreductase [Candidatus Eisenbacteria bacterium]|jgi:3-hydroxyisobutyrate dehydrogenase-like beta-hydroxyacid dehydrogenase|nr:NAD(P)-dependent oxidoreductase [Candidatus Eisenbacteria bacterium]